MQNHDTTQRVQQCSTKTQDYSNKTKDKHGLFTVISTNLSCRLQSGCQGHFCLVIRRCSDHHLH